MNKMENLPALKSHAEGKRDYKKEETRLWKRNYARPGFIYLVVKYNSGKGKYTNFALVPTGGTEEEKEQVYTALWEQLVKKFPTLK